MSSFQRGRGDDVPFPRGRYTVKFFCWYPGDEDGTRHFETLTEAIEAACDYLTPKWDEVYGLWKYERGDLEVDVIEVPMDRNNVLNMMNGKGYITDRKTVYVVSLTLPHDFDEEDRSAEWSVNTRRVT